MSNPENRSNVTSKKVKKKAKTKLKLDSARESPLFLRALLKGGGADYSRQSYTFRLRHEGGNLGRRKRAL